MSARGERSKVVALSVVSDEHINSSVALCPPVVELDDGGTILASRPQRALYESWCDYWEKFGELDADEKITVLNGDLGEFGGGLKSTQLLTSNRATIKKMILDVLTPVMEVSDKIYVVRGTRFHTGRAGWLEEMIAQDIDTAVPYKWSDEVDPFTGKRKKKIASWWHMRKKAAGVRFDICHFGSMGSLGWTEKHAALKLVEKTMWRYKITMGIEAPDVVIRSHRHVYSANFENYPTAGILTPCWSLITEYAYNTGRENDTATIGGIWFLCQDGGYDYKSLFYEPQKVEQIWAVDAEF